MRRISTPAPQGSQLPPESCLTKDARHWLGHFLHLVLRAKRGEVPAEVLDLPTLRIARVIFNEVTRGDARIWSGVLPADLDDAELESYRGLFDDATDFYQWLTGFIAELEQAEGASPMCWNPDHPKGVR